MTNSPTQIIFTGCDFEIASTRNADFMSRAEQDSSGRWLSPEFEEQMVCFSRGNKDINLGFLVNEIDKNTLQKNEDGELNLDGVYFVGNKFYK